MTFEDYVVRYLPALQDRRHILSQWPGCMERSLYYAPQRRGIGMNCRTDLGEISLYVSQHCMVNLTLHGPWAICPMARTVAHIFTQGYDIAYREMELDYDLSAHKLDGWGHRPEETKTVGELIFYDEYMEFRKSLDKPKLGFFITEEAVCPFPLVGPVNPWSDTQSSTSPTTHPLSASSLQAAIEALRLRSALAHSALDRLRGGG